MQNWLLDNIDYIFFIYGISFITLGISIIVLPKKESEFKIGKILWLLALYAIIHSIGDFLTIINEINEETKHTLGLVFTSISYIFLYEFGRKLLNLIKIRISIWILPGLLLLTLLLSIFSNDIMNNLNIFIGYFIRIPAGIMCSIGLYKYYYKIKNRLVIKKVKGYFILASISMAMWTLFCGLFRNEGNFFPANYVNTNSFLNITGFPIQIFRTLMCILTTISFFGILNIFKWDILFKLTQKKENLEEAVLVRTNELKREQEIHEIFNQVLILSLEKKNLVDFLKKSLDILISVSWLSIESKGAIFLSDNFYNKLTLKASKNLNESLLTSCKSVEFGQCLCGKAALNKEIVIKSSIDEEHTISYSDIKPHGHICLPIINNDTLYGVVTVYTNNNYLINDDNLNFLKSFTAIIAKNIENHQSKEVIISLNKELKDKNKNLEQFAYITSHDLQEPLRTISSFVDIVNKEYKDSLDDNFKEYMMYISNSTNRMRNLIKSILEYSRIGRQIKFEQVDCNLIIKEIMNDLNTNIKETNTKIYFNNLPIINANTTEIMQIFQNLITNAIKFRKKDICPEINIEGKKENDFWLFSIEDNGIGMDEKHYEKIFQIFQRLQNREEYEGLGIGLAFCKKIIEIHHGDLWVKSIKNKGSIFYFKILCNLENKN